MPSLYWKPFLPILLALASVGLVASFVVHVLSLLGILPATGGFTWLLHGGIFIVWIPAVILMQQLLPQKYNPKDIWKIALRGCPRWVEKAIMGLGYYAMANFILFMFSAQKSRQLDGESSEMFRGFSGHWMIFYAAAAAIFYSALNARDEERRCPQGHPVSLLAKFCEECGLPVSDS